MNHVEIFPMIIIHYFVIFESLTGNTKMAPHIILHSFKFSIDSNLALLLNGNF